MCFSNGTSKTSSNLPSLLKVKSATPKRKSIILSKLEEQRKKLLLFMKQKHHCTTSLGGLKVCFITSLLKKRKNPNPISTNALYTGLGEAFIRTILLKITSNPRFVNHSLLPLKNLQSPCLHADLL